MLLSCPCAPEARYRCLAAPCPVKTGSVWRVEWLPLPGAMARSSVKQAVNATFQGPELKGYHCNLHPSPPASHDLVRGAFCSGSRHRQQGWDACTPVSLSAVCCGQGLKIHGCSALPCGPSSCWQGAELTSLMKTVA